MAGNIITNSTVYCLMSVCSCFVMTVKFYIFSTSLFRGEVGGLWYGRGLLWIQCHST